MKTTLASLAVASLGLACAESARVATPGEEDWANSTPTTGPLDRGVARLRLLAFNDFHGNLLPLVENGRPIGGASTLTAYIRHFRRGFEGRSVVVHAGDHVGASPPESGLFQDEPSILWLSTLAHADCRGTGASGRRCDVVGTLGNHEFDEGRAELRRLLFGGAAPNSFEPGFAGSRVPYVSSNVFDAHSGKTLLPESLVLNVDGVAIGIIGAVLRSTPSVVSPAGVRDLSFGDEVEAVNAAAARLVAQGVRVLVLTIHQGLVQEPFEGATRRGAEVSGPLSTIAKQLHAEIDVVISGHTHAFTNAYLPRSDAGELLVTQALSGGRAVAVIDLHVERGSERVLSKTAEIRWTYGDVAPGNAPQPDVERLVSEVTRRVAPKTTRVVGFNAQPLSRDVDADGESSLGNLIADAQRWGTGAQIALTNLGGVRADLPAGPVTWGQLYTVQPFDNHLLRVSLTGKQVLQVLERQWSGDGAHFLQTSGLRYVWQASEQAAPRITELVTLDGQPIRPEKTYSVCLNAYLASGGDGFFAQAPLTGEDTALTDLDALVKFFAARPRVEAAKDGRVRRAR